MPENTDKKYGDTGHVRNDPEDKIRITEEQEVIPEPELRLTIAKDNMAAYLLVVTNRVGQTVAAERILSLLESRGIVYGIKQEEIELFCRDKRFFAELLCAEGDLPEDEEKGKIRFHFEKEVQARPEEREDGTVDYRNLGIIQEVKAGDVLCTVELPKPGKDGMDIFGRVVQHRKGTIPKLPQGTNTYVSKEGDSLIAKVDGCVCYKKGAVNVNDVYIIKGDVNNATGNVIFSGSVIVYGDVRTGFKITSGKDICVHGVVEGAALEAKENINISAGMVGMGRGTFHAGGSVVAKYFENTSGSCGNDIFADFYVNSNITACGNIVARGRRAAILGGSYKSNKAIYAGTVGSENNIATSLEIVDDKLLATITGARSPEAKEASEKMAGLMKLYEEFEQKRKTYQSGENVDFTVLKKLLAHKNTIERHIQEHEAKLKEMNNRDILNEYKIVVTKFSYSGVKITMGPFIHNVMQREDHTKYIVDENNILLTDVLPSDTAERI